MIKWLDKFLRKQGFRTKSYYDDCERIGIQRGEAMKHFLKAMRLTRQIIAGDESAETKEELNRTLKEYNTQADKIDMMENTLLDLPRLRG